MDDQTKMTLAAALVGGYVLGRTKKGKLALSVGTYLAGKRLGLEPRQLATEGMRRLGEIPQVAELQDQLKGELLEAGRKAVTTAATRGMGNLADTLRDRTAALGAKKEAEPEEDTEEEGPEEEEEGPEEEPEEEEEEEEEEPEEEEEEEEEEPEPERPQRRRSSRKPGRTERGTASRRERAPAARSSSGAASKEPSRKKSSATKPAAKKAAPAKKSAPKKQAPAKRAASSGRPAKKTSKRADRGR
ncbi:histone protein [Streptomyces sp. NPDC056663]|uniref:histone protein n=1 Tax=Streptomyces sp. NPDC056663 TaxID=3345899 RepID=UPI0036846065